MLLHLQSLLKNMKIIYYLRGICQLKNFPINKKVLRVQLIKIIMTKKIILQMIKYYKL